MSNFAKRLDVHFVAVAAAAVAANVGTAQAAIVHSGIQNLPVNADIDGLYVNVVTMATGTSGGGVPGWDINPYFSTNGNTFHTTGGGVVSSSTTGGPIALAGGTLIGPASIYDTGAAFGPVGGIGNPALIGFRFQNEAAANQIQYGWMRLRLPQAGAPGLIVDWAYEDTGAAITAGTIPAPSALGLLAIGAASLAGRRRKN